MNGAQLSWFSAWPFLISAIFCIALIVAVVRVEEDISVKLKN